MTSSPFSELPTELVLRILHFAARPDFTSLNLDGSPSPYATGAMLCLISKTFRRVVVPVLWHTLVISSYARMSGLNEAMKIQRAFAVQGSPFYVNLPAHAKHICVSLPDWKGKTTPPKLDYAVIAPLIFSARSLALNINALSYFHGCFAVPNVNFRTTALTLIAPPEHSIFHMQLLSQFVAPAFLNSLRSFNLCIDHASDCASATSSTYTPASEGAKDSVEKKIPSSEAEWSSLVNELFENPILAFPSLLDALTKIQVVRIASRFCASESADEASGLLWQLDSDGLGRDIVTIGKRVFSRTFASTRVSLASSTGRYIDWTAVWADL